MKIENVKYVPCSQDELWEKVDEIARYLRLTAEFGCAAAITGVVPRTAAIPAAIVTFRIFLFRFMLANSLILS